MFRTKLAEATVLGVFMFLAHIPFGPPGVVAIAVGATGALLLRESGTDL